MSLLKLLGIDKYTERLKTWVNNRVDIKVADLVDSAPETLDTLKEVADAIQANETVVEALDAAIGNKADKTTVNTLSNAVTSNTTSIEEINSALSTKADINGDYPDMTVGLAEDLGGRPFINELEFSFRATAGAENSIKDGMATIKRLKGNSVVWNQKVEKTYIDQDRVLYNIDVIPQNHKFALIRSKAFDQCYYMPSVDVYDYVLSDGEYANIFVQSHVVDAEYSRIYSSGESGYIQLIDLTLMFGAGNEPTTIEEFNARKPIVEDEYAYNEGEVIHMTAEGIKSVGDNAWDGLREMGDISGTTGEEFDLSSTWRAEGYIRILPNAEYCVEYTSRAFLRARFYDKHKNFIGIVSADNTDIYTNKTFTAPNNAYFIRFAPNLSVIPYDSELCVRLVHSGWKQDTDAGYQPYWEDRLMFDQRIKDEFPDGMKKWDMVYNKNGKGYIVKGTGVRTFEEGDTEDATVITDGSSTIYELATPEVIEYDEPFNLDYRVADFGTEQAIAEQPSTPISADIQYNFGANDTIRTNKLNIIENTNKIKSLEAKILQLESILNEITTNV